MSIEAFTALTTLGPKDLPKKVTSVAFASSHIFVGSAAGDISLFKLQKADESGGGGEEEATAYFTKRTTLLADKRQVPVTQLLVVEDLGMLLVLCDGTVTVRGIELLQHFSNPPRLAEDGTKGALCMCVDTAPSRRLCVATRKQLLLYQYTPAEQMYKPYKKISVSDVVVDVAWHSNVLCVAYKKQYCLVDVDYEQSTALPIPLDGVIKPIIQLVRTGAPSIAAGGFSYDLLLIASPCIGLFVSFPSGELANKSSIAFSSSPSALAVCGDYLVALLADGMVEVFGLLNQRKVQGFRALKEGELVAPPQPGGSRLLVASSNEVVTLRSTPASRQISQYLEQVKVDEAWNLLLRTSPSPEQKRQFHANAAFVLLAHLHFVECFKELEAAAIDPREVLSLFRDLLVPDAHYEPKCPFYPHEHKDIAALVKAAYRKHAKMNPMMSELAEAQLVRLAYTALCAYLWKLRRMAQITAQLSASASAASVLPVPGGQAAMRKGGGTGDVPAPPVLIDDAFSRALNAPEVKVAIDTALLVVATCVLLGDDVLPGSPAPRLAEAEPNDPIVQVYGDGRVGFTLRDLVWPENSCHQETSERFLVSRQHYSVLGLLLASRGPQHGHRKALELWNKLGLKAWKDRASPELVAAALGERSSPHPGVLPTVELLSDLDDCDLVWEFSEWVMVDHYDYGLEVFLNGTRKRSLEPEKVLAFLRRMQAKIAQKSEDTGEEVEIDLVQEYLEHLVDVEETTVGRYHDQLALLYLDRVLRYMPETVPVAGDRDESEGPVIPAQPARRSRPGQEGGELGRYRGELFRLLTHSKYISHRELLGRIKGTPLYEEMILLHSRLDDHQEVLRVYVYRLGDHVAAAEYCLGIPAAMEQRARDEADAAGVAARVATPAEREAQKLAAEKLRSDCFAYLLDIYFTTPSVSRERGAAIVSADDADFRVRAPEESALTPGTNASRAVALLNQYSVYIDPVTALRKVPPSVPVLSLRPYLERVMPHTAHQRRDGQVVKALSRLEHLDTKIDLNRRRARSERISPQTVCSVCRKKIQVDTYLSLPPDDNSKPVHYDCYQKMLRAQASAPKDAAKSGALFQASFR